MIMACRGDLDAPKEYLVSSIYNGLETLVIGDGESRPTAAFQRVIQRAVIRVLSSGREEVTGANILVATFAGSERHAAHFLQEREMTRYDASARRRSTSCPLSRAPF